MLREKDITHSRTSQILRPSVSAPAEERAETILSQRRARRRHRHELLQGCAANHCALPSAWPSAPATEFFKFERSFMLRPACI